MCNGLYDFQNSNAVCWSHSMESSMIGTKALFLVIVII